MKEGTCKHKPKWRSHSYRETNKRLFKSLGNGNYGGYAKGMRNGPEPRTDRGRRRRMLVKP